MVLKPVLEAIDIRLRKVQPTLYAVPMPAFLLPHDRLLCLLGGHSMRRLTSCGSRGAETNPPVHRRLVPFWIQYASRSVFLRSLPSALCDCRRHGCGRIFLFARVPDDALVHRRERSCAGDTSSSPRQRSGATSPSCCTALRTRGPFDVGSRPRMRS